MSSAFVKQDEEQQWLHEVKGTVGALQTYLTRENGGLRVFERNFYFDAGLKKEVHEMSNGLKYAKDGEGKWYVI
ncbi:MAG: hypothetical protein JO301_04475 [Chitinophagaceae bacterium]|nr:hypothetical protein [Chitinophagaceae bacterium]